MTCVVTDVNFGPALRGYVPGAATEGSLVLVGYVELVCTCEVREVACV